MTDKANPYIWFGFFRADRVVRPYIVIAALIALRTV